MANFIVEFNCFAVGVDDILLSSVFGRLHFDWKIVPRDQFLVWNALEQLLLHIVTDLEQFGNALKFIFNGHLIASVQHFIHFLFQLRVFFSPEHFDVLFAELVRVLTTNFGQAKNDWSIFVN